MDERPTQESFSRHLNTKFRVEVEAPRPVELELIAVNSRPSDAGEHQGMERFSAVFVGPPDLYLPQQTYPLSHDEMGDLQIFLVPVGRDEQGFRYEAVYNYFKKE